MKDFDPTPRGSKPLETFGSHNTNGVTKSVIPEKDSQQRVSGIERQRRTPSRLSMEQDQPVYEPTSTRANDRRVSFVEKTETSKHTRYLSLGQPEMSVSQVNPSKFEDYSSPSYSKSHVLSNARERIAKLNENLNSLARPLEEKEPPLYEPLRYQPPAGETKPSPRSSSRG